MLLGHDARVLASLTGRRDLGALQLAFEGCATAHLPAIDAELVLLGRCLLDADALADAVTDGLKGAPAAAHLLACWRKGGPTALGLALNGACCALVIDRRQQCIDLLTDRMGAFPLYFATDSVALATHPDRLADALAEGGRAVALDLATLAECLAHGYAVQPATYHQGIEQLDAATHYRISLTRPSLTRCGTWWSPAPVDPDVRLDRLADDLAAAFQAAGRRRAPELVGRRGVLLSGGADSRALLFAVPDPASVSTITFCDRDNPEVDTARQIALAARAPHRVLKRGAEYYGEGAWETVRITGGMWCLKDCHFHGFVDALSPAAIDNLMTGCYADYLYKGLALNRAPLSLLGKQLPVDRLAPLSLDYYQPASRIAPRWAARAHARLRAWQGEDAATITDRRIRPLSREADAMGRGYLLRLGNWDPVMLDNDLLAFYGRLPADAQLNARVFRKAVIRLMPAGAAAIPNNNDGARLDAPEIERVLRHVLRKWPSYVARRLGRMRTPGLSTDGSWPDFDYYVAHSTVLADYWHGPSPSQRELFCELLGEDPWQRSLADWARHDIDLILRLLTLRIWLTQRKL